MDEYPPEGRFAWDLIFDEMTPAEHNELCDRADEDDLPGAEEVVSRAERRLFGATQ